VATFSTLFVMLGVSATGLGSAVSHHRGALEKAAGAAIVMLGVFFIASPYLRRLNGAWHFGALARRAGRGGPVVAGAAFAIAWTPCVAHTRVDSRGGVAVRDRRSSALLLSACSGGLAVPFILTSVAFIRLTRVFGAVRRHYRRVAAAGGAVLAAMGVMVWTGEIVQLNIEAQQLLDRVGLDILIGV
jgi:cytochrome c-type biogenesis protein